MNQKKKGKKLIVKQNIHKNRGKKKKNRAVPQLRWNENNFGKKTGQMFCV
jgi:hypothetical protein